MTDKTHITLTHLNIRQSISILLAKLIFVDLLLVTIIILFFFIIAQSERFITGISGDITMYLFFFGITGIFKIFVSCYVILEWLHEYYELTPEYISHNKGVIFRKKEHYRLSHIRKMHVRESFFGELFNFATITLYDIRLNKYLDLYLIHNAERYAKVLKELRPQIEMKRDHIWLPFEKDEDILPQEDH